MSEQTSMFAQPTEDAEPLKALTFIQPWGSAVLTCKPYENRPWAPPANVLGKRIAVHAGARYDKSDAWQLKALLPNEFVVSSVAQSCLIGTVVVAGYVSVQRYALNHKWHFGISEQEGLAALDSRWRSPDAKFVWVLREPRALTAPLPCKGALGLWRVPMDIAVQVRTGEPCAGAAA